jgi:hypothetical protein
MNAYACPCCGYLTLEQRPPGTWEVCPVCGWEDDPVQFEDPSYEGGANQVSLAEARRNYLDSGAAAPGSAFPVRPPRDDEKPRS